MNTNKNSLTPISQNADIQSSIRKGAIVVLFALLLPVLIVILGFCIDYANMLRVRNEAQVVADLSAKAAADTLARSSPDENPVALARQAAKDVAATNYIGGKLHSLRDEDIIFGRAREQADGSFAFSATGRSPNSVRVNAIRDNVHPNGRVGLFFGQFYGNPNFELQQTATSSFRDVEIMLVLDRSGSMKFPVIGTFTDAQRKESTCNPPGPDSRWVALDKAIDVFLDVFDSTPTREGIGVVTFSATGTNSCDGEPILKATLDQSLNVHTDLIRDVMGKYRESVWHGGTDITAGIIRAKDHMIDNGNPQNREQYMVVLTDGVHNGEVPPFEEATLCAEAGISVHTITFGSEANVADMQKVADLGGGEHFHAENSKQLEVIFRRLAGTFAVLTE